MPGKTPREQLGVDLPEPEPIEIPDEQVVEEGPERPEWLPEKFKDESEFVTSYHGLEDELRRRGEEQKEMQAQLGEMASMLEAMNQPQPQPQQNGDLQAQLLVAYENDPLGTMIFLSQQAAAQAVQTFQNQQAPQFQQQQVMAGELMANNAERVLESKYPDWSEYGSKVGDVLERNPYLLSAETLTSMDATTSVLESIYKQVKYDDLAEKLEAMSNDQTQMKRQAQTVSGGAGRPGTPNPDEEKINRIVAAAKNTSYAAFRGGS